MRGNIVKALRQWSLRADLGLPNWYFRGFYFKMVNWSWEYAFSPSPNPFNMIEYFFMMKSRIVKRIGRVLSLRKNFDRFQEDKCSWQNVSTVVHSLQYTKWVTMEDSGGRSVSLGRTSGLTPAKKEKKVFPL